jgi:hypothetical protein
VCVCVCFFFHLLEKKFTKLLNFAIKKKHWSDKVGIASGHTSLAESIDTNVDTKHTTI